MIITKVAISTCCYNPKPCGNINLHLCPWYFRYGKYTGHVKQTVKCIGHVYSLNTRWIYYLQEKLAWCQVISVHQDCLFGCQGNRCCHKLYIFSWKVRSRVISHLKRYGHLSFWIASLEEVRLKMTFNLSDLILSCLFWLEPCSLQMYLLFSSI